MSVADQIVNVLLESGDIDPKQFVTSNNLHPNPKIKTTYSKITWHGAGAGDPDAYDEEHGFEDEEGEDFELDEFDREDGIDIPKKVARWLRDKGVIEASSSHFHPGIWYSNEGYPDMRTGAHTTRSFHLEGFSPDEEQQIFNLMFPPRRPPPVVFPNRPPE
jgi:hypothetical protein